MLRIATDEMKLILKSRKPKRLIGQILHHDGSKQPNSIEWLSVVAYVRYMPIL